MGGKAFSIAFDSGDISLEISRRSAGKGLQDRVKIEFSEFFKKEFSQRAKQLRRMLSKSNSEDHYERRSYNPEIWDLRINVMRSLIDRLGPDFVESQFFVPAGRSFYSSLGKAVAMLEHGSNLDAVTKRFGRRFTGMLDGHSPFIGRDRETARFRGILKAHGRLIERLLGGRIKLGGNDKHIETSDGRIIPLSLMSSGQQELLPLLLSMQEHFERNYRDKDKSVDILYVEEPEAHLFPRAQSDLIKFIVLMNGQIPRSRMFITTNSPYVLATLNNCLLAGYLGSDDETSASVSEIVERGVWLKRDAVSAYAMIDGSIRNIIDKNGLINGAYVDNVSFEISEEFERLLDIGIFDNADK